MEYDAQIDNEGVGNRTAQRQQGGVIGGTNLNWDASWIVKTEVGGHFWVTWVSTVQFVSGVALNSSWVF